MFAISRQITAINEKTGSIPFSGKSIPPDNFSNQYINTPINKAFIIMLMLFSRICLFLFLKLKILSTPTKTRTIHPILITGMLSEITTSSPVMNRNTAANTAKKVHIVCILCSIEYLILRKSNINFAQFKNKCRFALYECT